MFLLFFLILAKTELVFTPPILKLMDRAYIGFMNQTSDEVVRKIMTRWEEIPNEKKFLVGHRHGSCGTFLVAREDPSVERAFIFGSPVPFKHPKCSDCVHPKDFVRAFRGEEVVKQVSQNMLFLNTWTWGLIVLWNYLDSTTRQSKPSWTLCVQRRWLLQSQPSWHCPVPDYSLDLFVSWSVSLTQKNNWLILSKTKSLVLFQNVGNTNYLKIYFVLMKTWQFVTDVVMKITNHLIKQY